MATGRSHSVSQRTGIASESDQAIGLTDIQLLERFAALRGPSSEQAFGELVARHGPMVLGTCRRMLRDAHEADDAFQATFLVLARRAKSVRGESLAAWLHGVAYLVAMRARATTARRRERSGVEIDQWEAPVDEPDRLELRTVVDEEVHRLRPPYRAVVILSYLAGLTQEEVAERLHCPVGTVKSRLSRARDLLRHRLSRRGLALMAGLLAPALTAEAGPVAVPPALAKSSVRAATRLAAGRAAAEAGTAVLRTGGLQAVQRKLILNRLRYAGLLLLVAGVVSTFALQASRTTPPLITSEEYAHSDMPSPVRNVVKPARHLPLTTQPSPGAEDIERIASPAQRHRQIDPGDHPAYQSRRIQVGRDPDSQIRLALWYEAQGKAVERLKHLTLAALRDPGHVRARGLIGQVPFGGKWCDPDSVADAIRADDRFAARLADYAQRRDRAPATADAQWSLALWCDQVGLRPESQAHLTAVTRLDPKRDAAWRRLGYRKVYRGWRTPGQIAALRAEPQAQRRADEFWRAWLEMCRPGLADDAIRDEFSRSFAEVKDPRAVPSIWAMFALGDESRQAQGAEILSQVEGPAAARALAVLAIFGRSKEVRRIARNSLLRRDPRDYVAALISLLRDPIVYEVRPVRGPGSPAFLFVEGRPFSSRRLLNRSLLQVAARKRRDLEADGSFVALERIAPADHWTRAPLARLLPQPSKSARTAEQIVATQIDLIRRYNVLVREHNSLVVRILSEFLDPGLTWTRAEWSRAWAAELAAGFDPPVQIQGPEETRASGSPSFNQGEIPWAEHAKKRPILGGFCAGTPVRTMLGLRPVESLRLGDRVLSQDAASGALGFQPILAVCHRESTPTLRVDFEDDSIMVTAIHRFWYPGRGWVMARDLKVGDTLRTLDGLERVVAIEPAPAQPVFSLEVANSASFFAGRRAALVHDLTPVEPVQHPFDARWTSESRASLAELYPAN